jgi:cell division protein FtsB
MLRMTRREDAANPTPTPTPPPRSRRRSRSGTEARAHRRRIVSYGLLACAAVLMVNALVGENGYLASLRARRDYDSVMSDYLKLRLENQQLKEQARRLKEDPTAIEDAARRELGLIRAGETLVIVRDGAQKASR